MRYAMLICGEDDAWERLPDGEAAMNEVYGWLAKWEAAARSPTAERNSNPPARPRRSAAAPRRGVRRHPLLCFRGGDTKPTRSRLSLSAYRLGKQSKRG
jgi:hypothetical protein